MTVLLKSPSLVRRFKEEGGGAHKTDDLGLGMWYTITVSEFWKWRQEGHKVKVIFSSITRSRPAVASTVVSFYLSLLDIILKKEIVGLLGISPVLCQHGNPA